MNSDVEDLLSDVAERFEDVPDERLEARLHLINHVVGDLDTPARTRVVADSLCGRTGKRPNRTHR